MSSDELKAAILSTCRLLVDKVTSDAGKLRLRDFLDEIESTVIKRVMALTRGNGATTAKILGINRTTLVEKRRRLKLPLRASPCDKTKSEAK